ncbi:MAG: acyl-CoA dehydrogenase family protein [Acidocella sp.]|nr:acyl-CoA dehydrogenase family protein [Acidocella sp.]
MDLFLSPGELAFRDDVAMFIADNLPPDIRQRMEQAAHLEAEDVTIWHKILHAKGWAVTNWPLEWGGTDWSPVQRYIFKERLQAAPAPEPLSYNVNMIGPVLIAFGTPAQKQKFLPAIAALDHWWCQGFSEPNAGSDLASLKTIARRDGDDYVVNGQKIWTSQAQFADWMFCLVRTDTQARKQRGISFLLIDMKTPGVTVRRIKSLDNSFYLTEVFLDDVRVPAAQLVGNENEGWSIAKFLLGNERSGIARIGLTRGRLARARRVATSMQEAGFPLINNQKFRERLLAAEVELRALELTQLRAVTGPKDSADMVAISSILKLKGTELQQLAAELLQEAAGPWSQSFEVCGNGDLDDRDWLPGVEATYFFARAASIYGGSNEIQRNIISKSILGL